MKRLLYLFLFISSLSFSQEEIQVIDFASGDYPLNKKLKMLFDKDWKPTMVIDSASFFRITTFKQKNIPSQKITDFHITGEKQADVFASYIGLNIKGVDSVFNNGPENIFYKNGNKSWMHFYLNNIKIGEAFSYYESGENKTTLSYVNGLIQGKKMTYYKSGEIESVSNYVDGLVQGESIWYYETAGVEYTINYIDNLTQGEKIGYYKSGEVEYSINITDSLAHGERIWYYKSGAVEYRVNYVANLKQGKQTGYYESGEVESIANYLYNKLENEYVGYYKSGQKKYVLNWKNSSKEGKRIDYYESGLVKKELNYIDDLAQGKQVFYLDNGVVDYIKLWVDGKIKERRIALVIGNAAYEKGPLENPVNDANIIAKSLEKLDFEVFLHTDLATEDEMLDAIKDFGRKRENYEIGFVYYAGHGIQLNNENYLLPVNEEFEYEDDVEDNGVSMQRVLRYLESTRENQLNFIVLDACRDNPFESNWNKTRSLKGAGLAKTPPPTGSLIAFSTDHGQTAADGDGGNSLYSQALAEKLLEENVSIEQVFKNVRTEVLKLSGDTQSPVEESKLTGDVFYLNKTEE